MLKWLTDMTSPRQTPRSRSVSPTPSHEQTLHESALITELVLSEVEQRIVEFEAQREHTRSLERINSRLPDYSWLISADIKPKKYLTLQEKYKLENACERLKAEEWAQVLSNFKARAKKATTRMEILDIFSTSAHEVIASRPRNVSVTDILKKYTRSASSVNAVSYTTGGANGETVHVGSKSPRQPFSARTYGIYDNIV